MSEVKSWVITLDPDWDMAQIAQAVAAAGFDVAQAFEAIGILTGHATTAAVQAVRQIAGVAAVELDLDIHLS